MHVHEQVEVLMETKKRQVDDQRLCFQRDMTARELTEKTTSLFEQYVEVDSKQRHQMQQVGA